MKILLASFSYFLGTLVLEDVFGFPLFKGTCVRAKYNNNDVAAASAAIATQGDETLDRNKGNDATERACGKRETRQPRSTTHRLAMFAAISVTPNLMSHPQLHLKQLLPHGRHTGGG